MSDISPDLAEEIRKIKEREPKKITDIKPEEREEYFQVPAWRRWEFDWTARMDLKFNAEIEKVESKKLALTLPTQRRLGRYHGADSLLEPLTEEEVREAEANKIPLVTQEHFRRLVENSQTPASQSPNKNNP